jgi:hypothetical protein
VDGKIIVIFAIEVYDDELVGPIQRLQIKTIAEEVGEATVLDEKAVEVYEHYLRIKPKKGYRNRIRLFFQRKLARALLEGD